MAVHEEYLDLISAAVDGALTEAQAAALQAHLADCADCRALLHDLQDLHATLRSLPAAEPPAGLTDRVMAAVAADNVTPFPVKKAALWKRWGASAAVIALVVAGGWSLLGGTGGGGRPSADMAENAQVKSAALAPEAPEAAEECLPAPAMMAPAEDAAFAGGGAAEGQTTQARKSQDALPETALEAELPQSDQETNTREAIAPQYDSFESRPSLTQEATAEEGASDLGGALPPAPQPDQPDKSLTSAAAAPAEALTPREALAVLLGEYPMPEGAQLVDEADFLGWQTPFVPVQEAEPQGQQSSIRLEYQRITPNGRYYEFWRYDLLLDDPAAGQGHTATQDFLAVSLDGSQVLSQRDGVSLAQDIHAWDAYNDAISK